MVLWHPIKFELNDYLIRKHFEQFGMEVGYYDVCIEYKDLMEIWPDWVESYIEACAIMKKGVPLALSVFAEYPLC